MQVDKNEKYSVFMILKNHVDRKSLRIKSAIGKS